MRLSSPAADPSASALTPFASPNRSPDYGQPRRMGAPNGAPVAPPSTISSTALTYEESSEARKSTALASSSGSPQRPNGITEETNFACLADSSADIEARGPRFQIGVLVAPGATTFTRMLRGARSAAMARAIDTTPPLVAAYGRRRVGRDCCGPSH